MGRRRDRLARAIVDCGMDVFAAEEVDTAMFRQLPALVEAKGGNYSWQTFSPYDAEGKGSVKAQAIVYKTDVFEMLDFHRFWCSETPDKMSTGWDDVKFKRGACCATLRHKASGKRIFVMASHFPLGKEARLHFAPIVVARAKEYNPENLPSFLVGDLNTRQERPESAILREWWSDSYLMAWEKVGTRGTFNNHDVGTDMDNAPRIDFVYFRGNGVTPRRYVCNTVKYEGLYPSDHCPVYVDFTINDVPQDGSYRLANENVSVKIGKDGALVSLRNERTGQEYAAGEYMWRLYYDSTSEKEIQVLPSVQNSQISVCGDRISVFYPRIRAEES